MMRVWSHRPQFLHMVLFFCGLCLGLRIRSGARNRPWNHCFHLASGRGFHRNAYPHLPVQLAVVDARGLLG
jgi:hypothetical protein